MHAAPADQPPIQVWRGVDQVPRDLGPVVAVIGVFDGVHRGHRVIVDAAVRQARAAGTRCVAITFDPHPSEVVRPGTHPALLATVARRAELLGQAGVDAVLVLHFSPALARLTPQEFVDRVLVEGIGAVAVVVGSNFRYGHRAVGSVETLRASGAKAGFTVDGVALVGEGGVTWSSTYVRQCVAEGDIEAAADALGRPHRIEGLVVHGDHRGRLLGYPTANLSVPLHTAVPADGVYAGWLRREHGAILPAAISIGTNPTFDGSDRRVEAYVLGRDDLDLYGEHVAIDFVTRLRPMLRFDAVEALLEQMAADVRAARAALVP